MDRAVLASAPVRYIIVVQTLFRGKLPHTDVQHAVDDSQGLWFVVLQRALDEAAELATQDPTRSWLDAH
jgi:hypothetical protein